MIFQDPHIAQDMPPLPHGGPILTEIYDYEVKTYHCMISQQRLRFRRNAKNLFLLELSIPTRCHF